MRFPRAILTAATAVALALGCAKGGELTEISHGAGGASADGGSAGAGGELASDASTDVSAEGAPDATASDAGGDSPADAPASDGTSSDTGADAANPCAGVTCNTPPANVCADASNLTVYTTAGTCDQGQCSYASTPTACPYGCSGGSCTGDPCIGVTCATPPQNTCADSTHLLVYDLPGACNGGACSYPSTHQQYCQYGCAAGICNGDPCSGKTCQSPPANYCTDPTHLSVYDTPGTCTAGVCGYATHQEFCSYGCAGGACANDPCAGVSCNTPPAAYCTDASTLRVPTAGTCAGGACTYGHNDVSCAHGCVGGVCKDCAASTDCPAGKWCSSGTCTACSTDQHCGSACADCTASSGVCSGGATCVQCTTDSQCGAGNWCNAGSCAACNTAQHCGASCSACSGATPTCSGSACVCSGTSCGANQQCTGGACAVCKSDAACGSTCTACSGATPRCLDGGATSSCVACLVDADCTGGNVCGTSHTCVAPGCPPPLASCSTGTESRKGCANARTLGRKAAASKITISDSTCSASNNSSSSSSSCYDPGPDHTYKLYMRAGETASVQLYWSFPCGFGNTWQGVLKFYSSLGCADTTCPTQTFCNDYYFSDDKSFTATQDGWYFIVVDGNALGADEDSGSYTLYVKLTCKIAGCEC